MLSDYFSKIYFLNLDRDSDRKDYILSEFSKKSELSHHIEKFSAIDGRNINLSTIDHNIITSMARKDILSQKQRIYGVSMTYGALGCALSHKNMCELCLQDDGRPYLIFEDDVILDDNFDYHLQNLLNELNNKPYDIVYLGYHQIPHAKQTQINDVLSQPSGLICGTFGLFVSKTGAQKILDLFPLNYQIDSSISHNLSKFIAYCHTLQIVKMNQSFISNTQREYSCQNNHNDSDIHDDWNKLFAKS